MSENTENEFSLYLKQIQPFQNLFLLYLDSDDEEHLKNLQNYIVERKISESKQKFITMLCFISKISKNYHRSSTFISKIRKTITLLQPYFSQHCTNVDIFNIFKKNKLVLLMLFNEKILIPDAEINSIIKTDSYKKRNYPQFFYKEFQAFNANEPKTEEDAKIQSDKDFDQKRQLGENDSKISTLIRNDDIDQFIKYISQFEFNLNSKIEQSIFETNPFLIERVPTIIEYAFFYGSIQIIRYLICNGVSLTKTTWLYCIHSNNYELIHLLEDKGVKPPNDSDFKDIFKESIKCQHNEIAEYILNNKIEIDEDLKKSISLNAIIYHNYFYIQNDYEFLTSCPQILVMIVKKRYYELIHILLSMRVGPGILCSCVDATFGNNRKSTLFCAVENNDVEMIKVLMDCETFNPYGKSKIVKEIDKSVDAADKFTYNDEKTALFLAVERRYYEIVKLILSFTKSCNVDEESFLTVHHEGYLENTENVYTKCPIHVAIENDDNEMLDLLLKSSSNSIDVNIEMKIVNKLEKPFYFNCNKIEKKTPLHMAIEKENVNAVRLLLQQKKIDINKQYSFKFDKKLDGYEYDEDNQGNEEEEIQGDNERDKQQRYKKTALHIAVEKGNFEIVKMLLNHKKIDVNCREKYILIKPLLKIDLQKTALQIAIQKKEIDIIKLFLNQKSISINERTPYRFDRWPKTCPIYNDDGEEIPRNDDDKARCNIDCLKTPLHVAVETGCKEIIELLLKQKNIDAQIDDGQGKFPIDYTDNADIKSLFK